MQMDTDLGRMRGRIAEGSGERFFWTGWTGLSGSGEGDFFEQKGTKGAKEIHHGSADGVEVWGGSYREWRPVELEAVRQRSIHTGKANAIRRI
jgi:hypothetical protein